VGTTCVLASSHLASTPTRAPFSARIIAADPESRWRPSVEEARRAVNGDRGLQETHRAYSLRSLYAPFLAAPGRSARLRQSEKGKSRHASSPAPPSIRRRTPGPHRCHGPRCRLGGHHAAVQMQTYYNRSRLPITPSSLLCEVGDARIPFFSCLAWQGARGAQFSHQACFLPSCMGKPAVGNRQRRCPTESPCVCASAGLHAPAWDYRPAPKQSSIAITYGLLPMSQHLKCLCCATAKGPHDRFQPVRTPFRGGLGRERPVRGIFLVMGSGDRGLNVLTTFYGAPGHAFALARSNSACGLLTRANLIAAQVGPCQRRGSTIDAAIADYFPRRAPAAGSPRRLGRLQRKAAGVVGRNPRPCPLPRC